MDFVPGMIGQSAQMINGQVVFASSGNSQVVILDAQLHIAWEGYLTRDGELLEAHPTTIAHKEGYPTLIGVTKGFLVVDWDLFLADGNLDRAYIGKIEDPFATQYSRGTYLETGGKTYLVTADYFRKSANDLIVPMDNQIRFYDADLLGTAQSTGDAGVLVYVTDAPQFIQSMTVQDGQIVLARNTSYVHGAAVDVVDPETGLVVQSTCYATNSEIEGYVQLPDGTEIFLTGDSDGKYLIQKI